MFVSCYISPIVDALYLIVLLLLRPVPCCTFSYATLSFVHLPCEHSPMPVSM